MKDATKLRVKSEVNTVILKTNGKDVYLNTDNWDKLKFIVYGDLTLRPIGYVPAKYDVFKTLTDIMSYKYEYRYPDENGYDLFYEECSKVGCKVTDLFLCVAGPLKLQNKIFIPTKDRLIGIVEEKFWFN